jgi:glycosyltransferase involved in cell wall biosynthesis
VPTVFHTIHGFGVYVGTGPARWLLECAERLAAPLADRLIAVSDRTRQEGLAMGVGRHEQYVTIPYRIDGAPFVAAADRRRPVRDRFYLNGAPTVGMIACLKPQKAPHDFLHVARLVHQELPTARFLLIGDGELRASLEAEIRAGGLAEYCTLLGWRRDVPDLLAAMDVLVLTSRWEGLPIAVLEAMAAGKPVVVMDAGGVAEAVEDGVTGYVVRGRSIQTMAERVLLLLQSPASGAAMGQRGSLHFQERFSGLSPMVSQVEALYQKVWCAR